MPNTYKFDRVEVYLNAYIKKKKFKVCVLGLRIYSYIWKLKQVL